MQIKTSGEKILLVDDVKVVRSVYRQALENAGFQVVEAIDFEDAISQFDSSIDLAMVDIVLEGKSGLEILSHIRKQQPLCPVIMISGHANKNNAIDALHKGAVDYLEKPINLHELVHVAERWLSYRTLEEENIRLHEEQKLQHELRASQLHYDHLVEAIPDGILLACEGRIVYANSAAARILKATDRDTLIGSELLELAGPERRKSIADHIKHALQEQSPVAGLEGRLLRLNGQAFDAEFSISHTDHLGRDAVQLMFRDITDRKRTEKALCDSRERFTGIVESIPDAVVSIDESQKIIVFNRGAEKTFGYRRDEALGQSLGILIPKEFHERHRRHVDDFAASGTARSAEMRSEVVALRKSGEEFPVIASISKITVAGQQILTTIMHDITERKQAEAAIITSRSRLESIIDTSNDLIFLKDSDFRYQIANRTHEKLFDIKVEKMIGKTDFDFMSKEAAKHCRQTDAMALKSEDFVCGEENVDGKWFDSAKHAVRDSEGNAIGIVGVIRDITKRKQAEEALELSEARLEEAQAIAHIGSWERILATDEMYLSDEMFHILGLIPDTVQLSAESVYEKIISEDRSAYQQVLAEALNTKGSFENEHRVHHADGSIRFIHCRGKVILDNEGEPVRMVGTAQDVTRRKQAEKTLQEHTEKLERFNKMAVGRELRMIELKKEINTLLAKLGREAEYVIHEPGRSGSEGEAK